MCSSVKNAILIGYYDIKAQSSLFNTRSKFNDTRVAEWSLVLQVLRKRLLPHIICYFLFCSQYNRKKVEQNVF